jgi:hypothetical protein
MRLFRLLTQFVLYACCLFSVVHAQVPPATAGRQPRILILLDGSSSMLQPWSEDDSRFKAAAEIITTLMDSVYAINDQVEFALRVYGHQSPVQQNNCFDTRREVMFSKNNRTQMFLRLSSLRPNGVSPIAFSLKEAAEQDLTDVQHNAYSIILITDGGESCNGNICEVVRSLLEKKIFFKPYILSLVDYTPLKQQYDCLGTYLQVAYRKEITPAISTIMESYRKALVLPGIISNPLQTPVAAPAPKPVTVVRVPPTPAPGPEPAKKDTVVAAPKPAFTSPVILPKDNVRYLPIRRNLRALPVAVNPPVRRKLKVQTYALRIDPPEPEPAPVVRPKENIRPLPIRRSTRTTLPIAVKPPVLKKMPLHTYAIRIDIPDPGPAPVAARPEGTIQPTRTVPAATPATPSRTPAEPPSRSAVPAPFTVQTEESKETTLELFFTDGKGTFYKSTPQIQLVDSRTGRPVKKFYRTVDAAGNPDAQEIPPGIYDVVLVAKSKVLSTGITVTEQKKNKVVIKVSVGSLRFAYDGDRGRPVKEFEAIVTRRFDNLGPSIRQRCTAELEYAPGNYYVEVNTLPITRYNLDIDFGSTTELRLPQPGFVQFTNTNTLGRVTLYHPMGEHYVSFYALDVNGNPAAQQVQLKPGTYEAHFKLPNLPYARERVVKFLIKSNAITDVELE